MEKSSTKNQATNKTTFIEKTSVETQQKIFCLQY